MKKLLFFTLTIFLCGACAEDVMIHNTPQIGTNNRYFSFDSVTNPIIWRTFTSFEEMMNATQIPEKILQEMPTDTLVALCINHPMAGNFMCYNNQLKGVLNVMNRFNGFQELKKRKDAAEKILDFYENLDLDYDVLQSKRNPYTQYFTEIKPLQVGFTELVIASKEISALYSSENINRLERITNKKYESKLQDKKYNRISTLGHSLLIGAQIKLEKFGNKDIKLKLFVNNGGNISSQEELTEISRIIYSN